jgi:hypothetical protein
VRFALILLALVAGCAPGARTDIATAAQADSTSAFRLFRGSEVLMVDHLRLSGDSISGLQLRPHPTASQVPITVPVAEVDSVFAIHPDREGLLLFALPIAVVVVGIMVLLSSFGGD